VRVGVIADIHADLPALADAFAHLQRLGCDAVLSAGDVIDWGSDPDGTASFLREKGVPCVRGNHDYCSGEGLTADGKQLSTPTIRFLDSLPLSWEGTLDGVRIAMWHARPGDNMRGLYLGAQDLTREFEKARTQVLIVGHTHIPMSVAMPGGIVINPGSVLRTPSGALVRTSATFGVLDLPTCMFRVFDVTMGAPVEV
jgi:putative phosphoesterase